LVDLITLKIIKMEITEKAVDYRNNPEMLVEKNAR